MRILHRITPGQFVTKNLAICLLLSLAVLSGTVQAQEKGFDGIVQHLEKHYGAQRTKIPLLGVANFFIKIIRPAGVKSFKIAVFEEFNRSAVSSGSTFDADLQKLMPKDWKPFLRVSSRGNGLEKTIMYTKPSGKRS